MAKLLLFPLMCFFLLPATLQYAAAQQTKNADGNATFTYEEVKQHKRLSDIAPETTGVITSYTCTVACERKELVEFTCSGDSLAEQFHTLVAQCAPARCLCYFDKIIADGKPVKGFVIEVRK